MNPDQELDFAEAEALAATLATAKALCSLLELVRPIAERRAQDDVRFGALARQLHRALEPGGGHVVTIHDVLAELGGDR